MDRPHLKAGEGRLARPVGWRRRLKQRVPALTSAGSALEEPARCVDIR